MTKFTDLALSAPVLQAVAAAGYDTPTPIQAKAIPELLKGRDLLGIAQTGTGKTAAFALPILERLGASAERTPKQACKVLVLSPTRELASQIAESFKTYGRFMKVRCAVVYGGVSIGKQIDILRGGIDVVVATPGRLEDLIERRALTLDKVEVLVLDEVDQMLDLGFIHSIRKITGMLPKKRQNLFFSATMPKEIVTLANGLLSDPVRVEVTPVATTAERINQRVIHVSQPNKLKVLVDLLKDNNMTRTLVFSRTKHGADKIMKGLSAAGYTAAAIHGNKSQNNRERALAGFKAGKILVLVATDIAARGIDVDGVSHVINYDLPHVPESYVHRIGRTARAGHEGDAIAFCSPEERSLLRDIERTTRQTIPVQQHTLSETVSATAPAQHKNARGATGHQRGAGAGKPRGPRSEAPREASAAREASAPREGRRENSTSAPRPQKNWNPLAGEPTVMAPERKSTAPTNKPQRSGPPHATGPAGAKPRDGKSFSHRGKGKPGGHNSLARRPTAGGNANRQAQR